MVINLDNTDDYLAVDNLKDGILFCQSGTTVKLAVNNVRVTPLSRKEASLSGGVLTMQDKKYTISEKELSVTPLLKDLLEDGDDTLTIIEVMDYPLGRLWTCIVRNFVLQENLRDTITIETPVINVGENGVANKIWETLYSDVPCKVQELNATEVSEASSSDMSITHLIPVLTDYELTGDERVLHNGTYYSVQGWIDRDRLDTVMKLQVREELWQI